jgi:hypothetical protein
VKTVIGEVAEIPRTVPSGPATLSGPEGWNLLANPFSRPFSWSTVVKQGVLGDIFVFRSSYVAPPNGVIRTFEGFMIRFGRGGGNITIPRP